jgi:hydrogenase/urease accessory protein HupE
VFGGNVVLQVPLTTPAVITHVIPVGLLVTTPLPVPPPVTVRLCVRNTGSADLGCDITTWQGSAVQSPAHALNVALPVGVCCNVTGVLIGNRAEQTPLVLDPITVQLMPLGVLVTVPLPDEPDPGVTVRR